MRGFEKMLRVGLACGLGFGVVLWRGWAGTVCSRPPALGTVSAAAHTVLRKESANSKPELEQAANGTRTKLDGESIGVRRVRVYR
jgi:hypothetical protein